VGSCARCGYGWVLSSVDAGLLSLFCHRCGFVQEFRGGLLVRAVDYVGSYSIRWRGAGVTRQGGVVLLSSFVAWVLEQGDELSVVTYTVFVDGSWFMVDALSGSRVLFPAGEREHIVQEYLLRKGGV
jgi:hypothetical protein